MKNLLIKLLDYVEQKDEIYWGLCAEALEMYMVGIIEAPEEERIISYIMDNKPNSLREYGGYFWPKELIAPRVAWLKDEIEKL